MKRLPDLPHLAIVPTDSLQPHEHTDPQRAVPLVEALRQDGMLKNPPVVLPLGGERIRYVVLDGANRALALAKLGLPHALVQVAHPNGDSVDVKTWNHAVLCPDPQDLIQILRADPVIRLVESDHDEAAEALETETAEAYLAVSGGAVWKVENGQQSLGDRLGALNRVVASYDGRWNFERTSAVRPQELDHLYDRMGCLVVFPNFGVQDVVTAAAQGLYFPTGITRFVISPRALRVYFPVARLAADTPLHQKQADLEDWIKQLMKRRQIRFYAESTFLFDE
jgi:hypothetical protein